MTAKLPTSKAKNAYKLLDEVRALILAEPRRYNQRLFIERSSELDPTTETFPSCGTVGCVAGWVATLKQSRKFKYEETPHIASRILGLQAGQSSALFSPAAVHGRGQTVAHAKAGAAHIAKFQKDHKDQLLAKKV